MKILMIQLLDLSVTVVVKGLRETFQHCRPLPLLLEVMKSLWLLSVFWKMVNVTANNPAIRQLNMEG